MIFSNIPSKRKVELVAMALLFAVLAATLTANVSMGSIYFKNPPIDCGPSGISCVDLGAPISQYYKCTRQGLPIPFKSNDCRVDGDSLGGQLSSSGTPPVAYTDYHSNFDASEVNLDKFWQLKVTANVVIYWAVFSVLLLATRGGIRKRT